MDETGIVTGESAGRAWSFLIAGEDRQFQGNTGYEDVIEESYSYDSTVGNHRRVALDDLVVVRSGREALGIGYVEQLEIFPDQEKLRSRCPGCGSTGFKERTSVLPRFRCSPCGETFDVPSTETIEVTSYRAHYGGTWQALEGCLEKALLSELSLTNSDQQSIKALDYSGVLAAVSLRGVRLPRSRPSSAGVRPRPFELPGGRRRATVAVRRGQDAFRRALVRRYGMICAVTGPAPAEVLQAAHLRAFAITEQHRAEEGLLLRSDIHHLFDSGLLAIRPEDFIVQVAPSLGGYVTYSELEGAALRIPDTDLIDRSALAEHYESTVATW
ncbi:MULTISPECIES: HNH endonuclease [unclassified Streptomyces]|uniref:HNH endonuclease n=1 Tax=unclassified Streptomyces TaxID=2593676 RepID=UPI002E1E8217